MGVSLPWVVWCELILVCIDCFSPGPTPFIASYFKQGQLFGLSCFEKIQVKSESERGVRMKSVGLLAVGYSDLHLHQDFLQRQVR